MRRIVALHELYFCIYVTPVQRCVASSAHIVVTNANISIQLCHSIYETLNQFVKYQQHKSIVIT